MDTDEQHKSQTRLKRGRPHNSPLELARSRFWAWHVRNTANKSFAELERELKPNSAKTRDGGGFIQHHAWLKYSKGERCPLPPTKGDKSPVLLAEKIYPGTAAAYDSITWDCLGLTEYPPTKPPELTRRISPIIMNRLKPNYIERVDGYSLLLNPLGFACVALIPHIDALGMMLMQWRLGGRDRFDYLLVFFFRHWIVFKAKKLPELETWFDQFLEMVDHYAPELGCLSLSKIIGSSVNEDDILREVIRDARAHEHGLQKLVESCRKGIACLPEPLPEVLSKVCSNLRLGAYSA